MWLGIDPETSVHIPSPDPLCAMATCFYSPLPPKAGVWAHNLHIIKFTYFISVVFNKTDPVVLPVASVATLKYPNDEQFRGEMLNIRSQSQLTIQHCKGVTGAGTPNS